MFLAINLYLVKKNSYILDLKFEYYFIYIQSSSLKGDQYTNMNCQGISSLLIASV